ncbi:MAG: hypothetical protein R2864_09415 [Syntrophotaleaceae bacterium]
MKGETLDRIELLQGDITRLKVWTPLSMPPTARCSVVAGSMAPSSRRRLQLLDECRTLGGW